MAKKKDRIGPPGGWTGNKYAHLQEPQAQLDYHDRGKMTPEEIYRLAEEFIESSVSQGFHRVLIIVGKGIHSSEGPVIKPLLIPYLHQLPLVRRVVTARRDRGGEGALEIELG